VFAVPGRRRARARHRPVEQRRQSLLRFRPHARPSEGERQSDPHSVSEALAQEAEVRAKGAHPLLGLLELPPAWLAAFGRDTAEAFDACTNIAIGTAWLSSFESECAAQAPRSARSALRERPCVLQRYAEALRMPDLAAVVTLELRAQKRFPLAVFDAPIFPRAPAARSWGPDRLWATPSPLLTPPESP
jgi:hypothetical protein